MIKEATLREALEQYRIKVSFYKKGYAQERFRLEQLARSKLGSMKVSCITSVDVASYRDERLATKNVKTKKNLSPATVRLELSLLSNVFDLSRIEWGYCETNPVKDIRKPKVGQGRERRLTPRERSKILKYTSSYHNRELHSIVVIALETAMRQGEILNLQWDHINLRERIAHLPDTKNSSPRDIPLSLKARDALVRLGVKTKGKVFKFSSSGLKTCWRTMRERLEIADLHFHDLRHEAISTLFELNSLDMMEIAAISGHKSLSMLKRYTHLNARKLVQKLEGKKNKGVANVLGGIVPYPASIAKEDGIYTVKLLDFTDLSSKSNERESAVFMAQYALLSQLISKMRDGNPIPLPDSYLDAVDESCLIMIDPLKASVALS